MLPRVILLTGTKKGLFLLGSDRTRRSWADNGPFCDNWPTNDAIVDRRWGNRSPGRERRVRGGLAPLDLYRAGQLGPPLGRRFCRRGVRVRGRRRELGAAQRRHPGGYEGRTWSLAAADLPPIHSLPAAVLE